MPAPAAGAALAAAQAGALGVGISGGGFLLPFIMGVLNMLYVDLQIIKYEAPVAGASSGAISASVASGLVPIATMLDTSANVSEYCIQHDNCFGWLAGPVEAAARGLIGADGDLYANRHGRMYVSLTQPGDGTRPPRHKLVAPPFSGPGDMAEAIVASTYMPGWCGPRLTVKFRGEDVYDGSFAGGGEGFLPCPPGVRYCVRISTMPAGLLVSEFFTKALPAGGGRAKKALARAVVETAANADFPSLMLTAAKAYAAAPPEAWAAAPGRLAGIMDSLSRTRMPGAGEADIWPGRRHKLPVGDFEWAMYLPLPATADMRKAMFDLGRAEALSWAQDMGFPAAAGKSLSDFSSSSWDGRAGGWRGREPENKLWPEVKRLAATRAAAAGQAAKKAAGGRRRLRAA